MVLADDDARMREVVRLAVASRPVVVMEVATAPECLAAIAAFQPDAVLLGAELHSQHGQELIGLLRRPSGPPLPLLLLGMTTPSGHAPTDGDTVRYLPYPFDASDLLLEIDRLLRTRHSVGPGVAKMAPARVSDLQGGAAKAKRASPAATKRVHPEVGR